MMLLGAVWIATPPATLTVAAPQSVTAPQSLADKSGATTVADVPYIRMKKNCGEHFMKMWRA